MALPSIEDLSVILHNQSEPIAKRVRCLFYLRTIGTPEVVPVLTSAFNDPSLLLQHEICYVLGQINHKSAITFLSSVLANESFASISRHEAAEAIAAIGDSESISLLTKYAQDPDPILSDTCKLAISRIEWLKTGEEYFLFRVKNDFCYSIDPAPPFDESKTFEWLVETYNNTQLSLFDRYRALFSLRNVCTDEAVYVMAQGLNNPNFSDLFQHEICFVFGQMNEKASKALPVLLDTLRNKEAHYIIRHEATEAIGSITDSETYLEVL